MCDYCNCRSVPLIDALGEDHDALLTMADGIERDLAAGDEVDARAAMGELLGLLAEHTHLEEVALFPVVAATGEAAGAVAGLLEEHALVERLAGDLDGGGPGHWPEVAHRIVAELRAHIHREEHDVFPAAVRLVPAASWDQVHDAARAVTAGHH